jgi:hypothetical protein
LDRRDLRRQRIAAHDIESAFFGTSLGINLTEGEGRGHDTTARITAPGRAGHPPWSSSVPTRATFEIVRHVPYVLAGSIRDDGPLPDVVTDAVEAR